MKKLINKLLKSDKKLDRSVLNRIKHYEKAVKEKGLTNDLSINVYAFQEDSEIYLTSGRETFYFDCSGATKPSIENADFAAWIFLPIAMSLNKNLFIHGCGSKETKSNAERLSDVWACWMPKKYSLINVEFSEYREPLNTNERKQLLLFSGGVDSTYAILNKPFAEKPDLLTIQGMDYKVSDQLNFEKAIEKTNILAAEYADQRIMVRSNAYDIYNTLKIPPRLTFVFVLSSVSFLFLKNYRDVTMAADFALYQQFEELPYGSSIATDQLYASGDFKLETFGNDVTRAEKLPSILENKLALQSLSLCKDKKIRPENCGVCSKCVRTKYMMLAAAGYIPNASFLHPELDQGTKLNFNTSGDKQDAYIKSTYTAAFRNGNLDKIPTIVNEYFRIQNSK
jgi:hypothetical protein